MGMDVCGGHLDPDRDLMFILTMGLAFCFAFILLAFQWSYVGFHARISATFLDRDATHAIEG